MARRRTVGEIKRMLKRRLLSASRDEVLNVADDLREFAVANEFYCYRSVDRIASDLLLTQGMDRSQIESAIRRQSQRRR